MSKWDDVARRMARIPRLVHRLGVVSRERSPRSYLLHGREDRCGGHALERGLAARKNQVVSTRAFVMSQSRSSASEP